MARLPDDRTAFAKHVAAMMQQRCPGRSVELTDHFEMLINGRHLALDNLYRMVSNDPDHGTEIVEQFLEYLLEGESVSEVPLPLDMARPRIMPRIQSDSVFDHLDRELVVYSPFVNDTVVLYVLDMPHLTVSITVEQMLKWGINLEEIDKLARHNLAKYVSELRVRFVDADTGGRAAVFTEQDGYDASRLLLTNLYDRLAPEMGGNFLVACPARDTFLALTQHPDELVEKMHRRVEEEFQTQPYPITDRYFLVTLDGVAGTIAA